MSDLINSIPQIPAEVKQHIKRGYTKKEFCMVYNCSYEVFNKRINHFSKFYPVLAYYDNGGYSILQSQIIGSLMGVCEGF